MLWSLFQAKSCRRKYKVWGATLEQLEERQLLSAVTGSVADVGKHHESREHARGRGVPCVFWGGGFSPIYVTEGNSGTTQVSLTLMTSPFAKKNIEIDGRFELVDSISSGGFGYAGDDDFERMNFHATIRKGTGSTTVKATVYGDLIIEPSEAFQATITRVSPGIVIQGTGKTLVFIEDDDRAVPPVAPAVSFEDGFGIPSQTEGQTQEFNLILDAPSAADVQVTLRLDGVTPATTGDRPAIAPDDVAFEGGQKTTVVTIPGGSTSKSFQVNIVDDSVAEPTEAYVVSIVSAIGAEPLGRVFSIAEIADNDSPPVVTVEGLSQGVEQNSGITLVPVNFFLDHATDHDVVVHFETAVDTLQNKPFVATKKKDFLILTGTATIKAGETTGQSSVKIIGDTIPEQNERFIVRLTSVDGGSFNSSNDFGEVMIQDDDHP